MLLSDTPGKILSAAVLAFAGLAILLAPPVLAQGIPKTGLPEAQYTAPGTERCLECHAGERMMVMAATAHGNLDNPDTPHAQKGCESCHGPGSLHVSRARGGIGFPAMLVFGEPDSVDRQTAACVNCHGKDMGDLEGMHWEGSIHDQAGITCVDCHDAHVLGNPLADQEFQRKGCAECHAKQITNHRRFESKGILFDQLSCYDCHDVHQLMSDP